MVEKPVRVIVETPNPKRMDGHFIDLGPFDLSRLG